MKRLKALACLLIAACLICNLYLPCSAYGNQPEEFSVSMLGETAGSSDEENDNQEPPEEGAPYYVDGESGDDANDGKSPENAWKSIDRAMERKFNPGDSLLFRRGLKYDGRIVFHSSGTEDEPITISSYGEGGLPVLNTDDYLPVITLYGNSHFIVDSVEVTAPKGIGIYVYATEGDSRDITVQNCVLHDIFNANLSGKSNSSYCAIVLDNDKQDGFLRDITVRNCEIYNCDYGAHVYGISREWSNNFISPERSYNSGIVFDGLYMHDIRYDGLVLQSCRQTTVKNSRFINCAGRCSWACAPLWIHHSDRITVEYCEIAGSKNQTDGMAIDFDGRTTNSTYQYIYSHDNNRFVRNCCFDSETRNRNNTVQYCYSENDGGTSSLAFRLMNTSEWSLWLANSMENFTFKNNTIVNSGAFSFGGLKNSEVSNNVFVVKNGWASFLSFIYSVGSLFTGADIRNNSFSGMVPPLSAKNNVAYSDSLTEGDPYKLIDSSRDYHTSAPIGCFAG